MPRLFCHPFLARLLVAFALLSVLPGAVFAQESADKALAGAPPPMDSRQFNSQITLWTETLDKIEGRIGGAALSDADLAAIRSQAEDIRNAATAAAALANTAVEDKRRLIEALGPAPADDTTKEAPEVARQRAALNGEIADLDGRAKRAAVIAARADAQMLQATDAARKRIADQIMARGRSPFTLGLWEEGIPQMVDALTSAAVSPVTWWETEGTPAKIEDAWPTVLMVIVGATIMGWPIRRWLLHKGGPRADIEAPSYTRRVLAATAGGLASCVNPVLAIGSILLSFEVHGLLFGDFEEVARGLALGFSIYLVIAGFAHVALQPHQPQWRVAPLSEESADTLDDRLKLLAVMLGINSFIWVALDVADTGTAFAGLLSLFGFSIIALGLWPILGDRAWYRSEASMAAENASGDAVDPRLYVTARRLLRLVVLTIPITALAGYYNLSEFLTRNVVLACALFAAFFGLTTLVSELTSAMLTADSGPLKQVRRALGVSEDSGRIVHFWIAGFLNVLIAIGLFLAFLPSAGVPTQEIADFLETGLNGVKIGNFTISFTDILLGIVVFIIALRLTRMAQRLLEKRILPQTRLDTGVRNSIRSAAGYAGATLGLVIAVSTAGIDFSNVAIIAGALSVGIGFGLQNIVNNFISGLIVLVERPVKVGDWVIVGGNEGTVKKISVRATEIETFKRATVIVPNGELISQSITNFTLRNKLGRIDIPLTLAYGTDPSLVDKTLIELATSHKAVLSFPKPRVIFKGFTAGATEFELRFFIANIEDGLAVRSDLMFAIERTFRERNILLPAVPAGINIKDTDLDRLETMLARLIAPRTSPAGEENTPDDRA